MSVTKIETLTQLNEFRSSHPHGWCLGNRSFWRIQPIGAFRQNPDTGSKVFAIPDTSEMGELVTLALTNVARTQTGSFRRWGLTVIPGEVSAALSAVGYVIDGMGMLQTKNGEESAPLVNVRTPRGGMRGSMPALPAPTPKTLSEELSQLRAEEQAIEAKQAEIAARKAELIATAQREAQARREAAQAALLAADMELAQYAPPVPAPEQQPVEQPVDETTEQPADVQERRISRNSERKTA